jgi:hypothetical protein
LGEALFGEFKFLNDGLDIIRSGKSEHIVVDVTVSYERGLEIIAIEEHWKGSGEIVNGSG